LPRTVLLVSKQTGRSLVTGRLRWLDCLPAPGPDQPFAPLRALPPIALGRVIA